MKKENQIQDEIIGKIFEQNCGDSILVLEKTNIRMYKPSEKTKRGDILYLVKYLKYPFVELRVKWDIMHRKCVNPRIEIEEFINKIWPQHCGDSLRIIEKETEGLNKGKWKAEFINCKYKIFATKEKIKEGSCFNYKKFEQDLLNQIYPQHCGDSLKILRILKNGSRDKRILVEAEFQQYKCIIQATIDQVRLGFVDNLKMKKIKRQEFLNKIHVQKYGDSLKVIEKDNSKKGYWWICEFQKYKCRVSRLENEILEGTCINPLQDQYEFIGHEFPQHCGDILIPLKRSKDKKCNNALYICRFKKYPYLVKVLRSCIKFGSVDNPALPLKSRENLLKFIKRNFKGKKPTPRELAKALNVEVYLHSKINEFGLRNYISYCDTYEQDSLKDYIELFYKGKIIENFGSTKEYEYKELDIYLIDLKIGFEYNGSHVHKEGGDPNRFGYRPIGYHENKIKIFLNKGIKIENIWDYEWFESRRPYIINSETQKRVKNIIVEAAKKAGREDLLTEEAYK